MILTSGFEILFNTDSPYNHINSFNSIYWISNDVYVEGQISPFSSVDLHLFYPFRF